MKSLTGKFSSKRGWALLLILFVGAGLLVAACGDEDVPAPTTPAPPPPAPPPAPEPEPEPEPPAAPTGLRVTEAGNDFIEWSWNSVEGVIGYVVQRSTNEAFTAEDPTFPQTAEQITHRWEGLEGGADYYVRVQSVAGSVEEPIRSDWTTHVTGMTAQLVAPDAPANLRVTGRGADYIEWTWDEVTGADGYRVQYSLDDEQFNDQDASEELPATQNSYRVGNLSVDMDVYLRVQSFVGTGTDRLESSWSTHVTGMTEPPPPMAPDAPTGLMVSETGDNFIEWSWSAVSGADGYEVQFSEDSQFTDDDPSQDVGADLSYRRTGLGYETRGYLRVRAYTGSGADRLTSEWSGAATGLTRDPPPDPAVPAGLSATGGDGMVTWSWRAVQDVDGYQIQYSDNEAFTSSDPMDDLTAEDLSYTRENLEPDTTHYLRVRSFVVANDTRFESDWAGPVSGRTDLEMLTVPTGLAVDADATDHDSIGWTWDAVSGVDGYEAQFSIRQPFVDTDQTRTISGENNTSFAAHNLEAEANGYLRVRSVVGTGTSARRSDWSAASMGTTTAAPVPTRDPLNAPGNVTTSAAQDNSITVTWDEVDDAETYQVEQRADGGAWVAANCGSETADNEVDTEECVASGLSEDTEYDFRVKAFPDSSDATLMESEWSSTASGETTGEAPAPPIMIEDDELGLQWSSAEDADNAGTHMITWDWDPVADRAQRDIIDNYVALLVGADDECPALSRTTEMAGIAEQTVTDTVWRDLGSNISATLTITGADAAGATRGLCVVRSWDDDRDVRQFGDVSLAWASTVPNFNDNAAEVRTNDTTRLTTSITWDYEVDEGFRYELRVLSVDRDDMLPAAGCGGGVSAGSPSASTTNDVSLTHRETSLTAYSHYRLCVRATNGDGASAWQGVGDAITRPTAPSALSFDSGDSQTTTDDWGGQRATRLVWTVAEKSGTPRDATMYEAKGFRTTDNIASGNLQDRCTTVSGTELEITPSNTGMGIALTTTDSDLDTSAASPAQYHFYACLRADPDGTYGNGDEGAWAVAKQSYVDGRPTANIANIASPTITASAITWTWDRVDDATAGYEVLFAEGASVTEDTAGVIRRTVGQPSSTSTTPPTTRFTGLKASTGYAIRIRYRQTVSGRTLVSTDNTSTASTVAQ